MSIDFISVLLFLGMGQSIFMILTLGLGNKEEKTANVLLSVLLFAFLWYQFEFFLLRHKLDAQIPFIYSTRYGAWLLMGPLVLLYNRATLIKGFKLEQKHLLHLLPFLLFTIIIPLTVNDIITNRAVDYGMLTVFDRWNREPISLKQYIYGGIFLVQFFHAAGYTLKAYLETSQLLATAKNVQSSIPEGRVNTLRYLYVMAFSIILLCFFFTLYQFSTSMWRRNFDYFYVLPMMVFVFGLAYRAIRYPNTVLLWKEEKAVQEKYAKSNIADSAKKFYLKKLEKAMAEEQIYQQNGLKLSDLALHIEISNHHLSQLLNEEIGMSFFDYINRFRVEEAKEQIKLKEQATLLEIAFAVGFNNKNSFNTAFKKMEGMTPSSFKKNLNKG